MTDVTPQSDSTVKRTAEDIIAERIQELNDFSLELHPKQAIARDLLILIGVHSTETGGSSVSDHELVLQLLHAVIALENRAIALEKKLGL